jgi:transposase InsO family protein
VAFVVDLVSRRIVGWRVSASLATDFVRDALEQAPCRCAIPIA